MSAGRQRGGGGEARCPHRAEYPTYQVGLGNRVDDGPTEQHGAQAGGVEYQISSDAKASSAQLVGGRGRRHRGAHAHLHGEGGQALAETAQARRYDTGCGSSTRDYLF